MLARQRVSSSAEMSDERTRLFFVRVVRRVLARASRMLSRRETVARRQGLPYVAGESWLVLLLLVVVGGVWLGLGDFVVARNLRLER